MYKNVSYLIFKDDHRLCFQPDHFPANHLDCLLVQKVKAAQEKKEQTGSWS
jgi:hypothetical protein